MSTDGNTLDVDVDQQGAVLRPCLRSLGVILATDCDRSQQPVASSLGGINVFFYLPSRKMLGCRKIVGKSFSCRKRFVQE